MQAKGYTLSELIVVLFLMGLLSVLALPSWLSFLQRQQVRIAAAQLHSALLNAKSEAAKTSVRYAVTVCSNFFRSGDDTGIKYSIHSYAASPSQFETIQNVSLVKSTVKRSPARYNGLNFDLRDCYTTYLGLFPGDGYALGFFYISGGKNKYVHRVGFNTLIGNVVSCPVVSLENSQCR